MTRALSRWVPMLVACLVLVGIAAYSYIAATTKTAAPPPAATEAIRPDVSVVVVRPGRYRADVSGYGAAEPHYDLTLTAQVSGRVLEVAASLEAGERVAEGQLLARLEDSDYKSAVASAEYDLADARQTLLEEERERVQAKAEWKASGVGGQPASALVLHGPQVATAKANVVNAEAALASARLDLDHTNILAPFDALVVERSVAPGSYVQTGGDIATLYSTDRVDITVALSARDWTNLPDIATLRDPDGPAVTLVDVTSGHQWTGHVLRAEGHRSETTRQRNLVIGVKAPLDQSPSLIPGTFLQAHIPGKQVDGLWRLPSAALSQQGEVWFVDQTGALDKIEADQVFASHDYVYIQAPDALKDSEQRVLIHPLNSYVVGMMVHPVTVSATTTSGANPDSSSSSSGTSQESDDES